MKVTVILLCLSEFCLWPWDWSYRSTGKFYKLGKGMWRCKAASVCGITGEYVWFSKKQM